MPEKAKKDKEIDEQPANGIDDVSVALYSSEAEQT